MATTFIEYKNKGFWVDDIFMELFFEYLNQALDKMKKIEFISIEKYGDKSCTATKREYSLISTFLQDFQQYFPFQQEETIENLKSVLSGEKEFDDIQDPRVAWSFGGGQGIGYMEIEDKVVYFEPDEELTDAPRVLLPLEEFIAILKEWMGFLRE